MPAQRKRVFVAGGQVADTEHADQGFQLVCQRHHHTGHVAGQLVAGKARLVVVFDREGNVFGQAIVARVIAAHDALQLGELPHHVGQQIGLGQLGRGVGALGQHIATQLLADGPGNRSHPLHPLALGTQLVVVNHLGQALDARGQCLLAVLVEEEFGIGQSRAHHPLVATDHRARVVGGDVAHHKKLVRQQALHIEQREVFLVGLHREDQALGGHVKECLLELAGQHVGPLHQRGHFVKQRVVFDRSITAAHPGRCSGQLARDLRFAILKRGDHGAVLRERGGVAVGLGQHQRVHRRFETVAVGGVARRQAQRLDGHHGAAVQRHQPMRRAHKLHAAPAGQFAVALQLVGHDFGDGQLGYGFVQRFL